MTTFRTNFFGESIAQPAATIADIENMLFDKHLPTSVNLTGARLSSYKDSTFKFGGELLFVLVEDTNDDDDTGADTIDVEHEVTFDGFETLAKAHEWVIACGVPAHKIEMSA
jgi:hypothetical protein